MRRIVILCAALLALSACAWAEGEDVLGTPAPEFEVTRWVQSEPLTLSQLHGSLVLVRFWTDTCPACSVSAPVLARLHERYARDGLVVIGIYHPKPAREVDPEVVRHAAETLGMKFPIGLDADWTMLSRYWLTGVERQWTSASFLIDRQGTIRFIHPGGRYTPEEARALEEAIILLLARRS